jgi:hypothetical protein
MIGTSEVIALQIKTLCLIILYTLLSAQIDRLLQVKESKAPHLLSQWISSGMLSSSWRIEPAVVALFASKDAPVRLTSLLLSPHSLTHIVQIMQKRSMEEMASVVSHLDNDAVSMAPMAVRSAAAALMVGDSGGDALPISEAEEQPPSKRLRAESPSSDLSAISKRAEVVQAWNYVAESASRVLADAATCRTRLKAMSPSAVEQAVLMTSLSAFLDTAMELCLSATGRFLTALAVGMGAENGLVRVSGAMLLSQCIQSLALTSTKTITDDVFLLLIDKYTDSNERSMRYLPLFLTLVVLPRLRSLTGPGSRVLLKALEILAHRCSKELVRYVLCRSLVGAPFVAVSHNDSDAPQHKDSVRDCGFQLECIQRMLRQVNGDMYVWL